jgi:hypothetical protein
MYLSLENDAELTEKYIEKVVYHLHPCYVEKRIEIRSHPYLLSRTAFGKFIVGCEIWFSAWTEMQPMRIDHLLSFEERGK